jgi:hypothetical protein
MPTSAVARRAGVGDTAHEVLMQVFRDQDSGLVVFGL